MLLLVGIALALLLLGACDPTNMQSPPLTTVERAVRARQRQ